MSSSFIDVGYHIISCWWLLYLLLVSLLL